METFKDIPNYEGLYQAGTYGNIKSLIYSKGIILKPKERDNGYKHVTLYKNRIKTTRTVHQLMAITFLGHIPNGSTLVVNHKDFNRGNNKLSNLDIVTMRENSNQKHLNSSSQYTGVSWRENRNKWQSEIWCNRESKYLGLFNNEIDAHNAYQNELSNYE